MSLKNLGNAVFAALLPLALFLCPASAQSNVQPARAVNANSAPLAPLTPELKHRIVAELRSQYRIAADTKIDISGPTAAEMPGYDTISVTFNGENGNENDSFLLSKDRKTLARLEKYDISKGVMSQISLEGRPMRGNPNAKVTVVVFDDFQCPYCGRMYNTFFPEIFNKYKDKIKVVVKDYPLTEIHPWAMHAAVDANCIAEQNTDAYWSFSDFVHENQQAMGGTHFEESVQNLDNAASSQANRYHLDQGRLKQCIAQNDTSAIQASIKEGNKVGVESTPTMFVNDVKYLGAMSGEDTSKVLDAAIAEANQQGAGQ